jgi:uncharacterized protein (DUF1684 family)
MIRELAGMDQHEVTAWEHARRSELLIAHASGMISDQVYNSILEWISENVCEYLNAAFLGLIEKEQ